MGRLLLVSLPATGAVIYRCKHCDTHLAYATDIISRMFRCKKGKAYLMEKMVNVNVGEKKEDREMTTGLHTVCDIFCVACGSILGWKYLAAFHKCQRYKEGKFIMDRDKVLAAASATTTMTPSSASSSSSVVHPQQHHQQHSSADDDQQTSDEEDSSDHQD